MSPIILDKNVAFDVEILKCELEQIYKSCLFQLIAKIKSNFEFPFPYEDFLKQEKPKIKPLSFKLSVSSK